MWLAALTWSSAQQQSIGQIKAILHLQLSSGCNNLIARILLIAQNLSIGKMKPRAK
jgi:hypothetical protein